jgi:hypothetical protein
MARTAAFITLVLLVFWTFTIRAMAMAPNPKKESPPVSPPTREPARAVEPATGRYLFTPEETITIRGYFRSGSLPAPAEPTPGKKMKTLPPGLQKKVERGGELPPGWQKKIARGEVLDAQVYGHSRPLPPDLLKRLPPQPSGTIVITIEGKVVRLLEATLTILDVFDLL